MIKILALITMAIDHIGVIFFPEFIIFRVIGRLSMPLFAYSIANGFYYSKMKNSLSKYIKNLSIFTVISQIPYNLFFDGTNIGITWLISVLILIIIEKQKKQSLKINILFAIVITSVVISVQLFLDVDYGIYGISTPIIMYEYFIKKEKFSIGSSIFLIMTIFNVFVENGMEIQFFSLLALIIIKIIRKYDKKIILPKIVYYIFYPLHLIAFKIITLM